MVSLPTIIQEEPYSEHQASSYSQIEGVRNKKEYGTWELYSSRPYVRFSENIKKFQSAWFFQNFFDLLPVLIMIALTEEGENTWFLLGEVCQFSVHELWYCERFLWMHSISEWFILDCSHLWKVLEALPQLLVIWCFFFLKIFRYLDTEP